MALKCVDSNLAILCYENVDIKFSAHGTFIE